MRFRGPGATREIPWFALPLAGALVLIAAPTLGLSPEWSRQVILVALLALVVSGLNLSFGYAGELALGQVAMYATGAYVAGYLAEHGSNDLLLQAVAGGAAALVVGVVSGAPGVRLGGWALAMVSFFLVLLIPDIVGLIPSITGGQQGLFGLPATKIFGRFLTHDDFYRCVLVIALLWFVFLRNVLVSRHGIALDVLRQSTVLASSLGISVYRLKLRAYALGAVPAGIAGALFANLDHLVSPESFGFSAALAVLSASVVGGSRSVYGAVLGAAILQLGPLRTNAFHKYADLVYGIFLVVVGVLLAGGMTSILRRLRGRVNQLLAERRPTAVPTVAPVESDTRHDDEPFAPVLPATLVVEQATKRFGGMRALSGVTLEASAGRVTALIGPNGSGKTTLLNVICGFYRADGGAVRLGDEPLSGLPPHRIARAGVRRTFQTPNIPSGITVRQAVIAGRYASAGCGLASTALRSPRYRRLRAEDTSEADRALAFVGLHGVRESEAASLPLGTRRLLELARALVGRPSLLLLDEIASGLDEEDVAYLSAVIRRISASGVAVLLVEHNFPLVLELADHIFVLAEGELIASGSPAVIEREPRVAQEYLGTVGRQPSFADIAHELGSEVG